MAPATDANRPDDKHVVQSRMLGFLDALSALQKLVSVHLQGLTEQGLIREALAALVPHLPLENCSVFLLDDEELVCAAGTGFEQQAPAPGRQPQVDGGLGRPMRFAIGEGIMGLAFQTRELQYSRDCQEDERFKPFTQQRPSLANRSLIAVPLIAGEDVLGVLNVSHPSPDFFADWHQHMLRLFAGVLAKLIHAHRLVHRLDDEVRRRTAELSHALAESRDLQRRYQRLSSVDELTGLHNRRYFFAEAESLLARALRYGMPLSLLLLDIDHFKEINDAWGHAAGDEALQGIARILSESARSGDLVARLGGEEFVLMLPNTGVAGADLLGRRIQQCLLQLRVADNERAVTASIGITALDTAPAAQVSLEQALDRLLAEADRAMYRSKHEGRNRRRIYDQQLQDAG